jgi:hypothetical protein
MPTNTTYPNAESWTPLRAKTTNIVLGNIAQKATGFAVGAIASLTGIPVVSQIGQSLTDSSTNYSIKSTYAVATLGSNKSTDNIGIKFPDFRARKFPKPGAEGSEGIVTKRLDGSAAAARTLFTKKTNGGGFQNSIRSAAYAAGSISPFGPYTLFNLETTYGWGDHDNPYALRNDFTAQSHVATQWSGAGTNSLGFSGDKSKGNRKFGVVKRATGEWSPTKNLISKVTPFRGDKVNVIDFSKRTLKDAYRWLPKTKIFGVELPDFGNIGKTSDFIKFFLTGPKLHAGTLDQDTEDDIIVFRATIGSLSDSFNANWSEFQLIGRGDPNYQYQGFSRDLNVDFTVYATDRDEVKPIWRKLNALAGYTAPEYTDDNLGLVGPWMRITIGDLFNQQPVILKSVSYTLVDGNTTWENNIEKDPQMMQTPHKIEVNLTLTPITDWLPQKGGRFYSLAKRHNKESGLPIPGNDNWLSDTNSNGELDAADLEKIANRKVGIDKILGRTGGDTITGKVDG